MLARSPLGSGITRRRDCWSGTQAPEAAGEQRAGRLCWQPHGDHMARWSTGNQSSRRRSAGRTWMLMLTERDLLELRQWLAATGPPWNEWEFRLHAGNVLILEPVVPLRPPRCDRGLQLPSAGPGRAPAKVQGRGDEATRWPDDLDGRRCERAGTPARPGVVALKRRQTAGAGEPAPVAEWTWPREAQHVAHGTWRPGPARP